MQEGVDRVAFLGIAEAAAQVRDSGLDLYKWNVLGLKHVVISNLYPLGLDGLYVGLAITERDLRGSLSLRIQTEAGEDIGTINLTLQAAPSEERSLPIQPARSRILMAPRGWIPFFIPIKDSGMMVMAPGRCSIMLRDGEAETLIGEVYFLLVDPPPLTKDMLAAIRSDPRAMKAVRIEFGCKKCSSRLRTYAALERTKAFEDDGWIWYQDLPDKFTCSCGTSSMDLGIIRRNLFAMLGRRVPGDANEIKFEPLYERGVLEDILTTFQRLLQKNATEEELQQCIERNPILLHQFPANRLFFKPPVLTHFKADFAIVTSKKELVLIEIERAETRLLRKDGGEASGLRHAIDQVTGWLHTVDEHRLAVLDSLGIDRHLVSKVRGVVIAGRDAGYDAEHLRRLKGVDRGRVDFLTFDDLGFGLAALIRSMDQSAA